MIPAARELGDERDQRGAADEDGTGTDTAGCGRSLGVHLDAGPSKAWSAATGQVVQEQKALETEHAKVEEAQDKLHHAKTAAREAQMRAHQVRAQNAGGWGS